MKRRRTWTTPLLLLIMSAMAVALCLKHGMDVVAFGWTAAAICSLAWLARELDPRG